MCDASINPTVIDEDDFPKGKFLVIDLRGNETTAASLHVKGAYKEFEDAQDHAADLEKLGKNVAIVFVPKTLDGPCDREVVMVEVTKRVTIPVLNLA